MLGEIEMRFDRREKLRARGEGAHFGAGLLQREVDHVARVAGLIAVALGFLCIRHPGAPLTALVVLIGILAIVFGAVEVVGAFSARHATKHWEAYKNQVH